MSERIGLWACQDRFLTVVEQVQQGDTFEVMKDGEPVAVIIPPEIYDDLMLRLTAERASS